MNEPTPAVPLALPVAEGFRRWAPTYEETPLSLLEVAIFSEVAPPAASRRLLDAGCGTGRRLAGDEARGAALAVGVDLVGAMLRHGRDGAARGWRVQGDLTALPFRDGACDLAWCRLTVGFLPEVSGAFRALARVLGPGGELVMTDLHPEATLSAHVRSFRDAEGVLTAVEHHVHPVAALLAAAGEAGLALVERRDLAVGPPVREIFERFGGGSVYQTLLGRPVVLALRFRRP